MGGMGMSGGGGFEHLFDDFSGLLFVGSGYADGVQRGGGYVVRIGFGAIRYEGIDAFEKPRGLFTFDCTIHVEDIAWASMGFVYQRAFGRALIGGGASLAEADRPGGQSDYALMISPEVALPLRWRAGAELFNTAMVFARADVMLSGRDGFSDQLIAGVSIGIF